MWFLSIELGTSVKDDFLPFDKVGSGTKTTKEWGAVMKSYAESHKSKVRGHD